ncbi:hypothetical protein ACIQV3_38660 [Streptomyces sp. NPDC099050]|uniref:hypothetical protein n=1 Tax=Streptomyces sp. NPDC099050 TaxID=3366100 RepID=UPI0037FF3664
MNSFKNVAGASFIVLAVAIGAGSAITPAAPTAATAASVAAPAFGAGEAPNDFGWQ